MVKAADQDKQDKKKAEENIDPECKRKAILIEYQKAQDSAEHYNNMVWVLIPVGFGLSLILLNFTLFGLPEGIFFGFNKPSLQSLMILINMFILTYFTYLVEGAILTIRLKYKICKRIERENKFLFYKQHLKTKKLMPYNLGLGDVFFKLSAIFLFLFLIGLSIILALGDFPVDSFNSSVLIISFILQGGLTLFFFIMQILYIKY